MANRHYRATFTPILLYDEPSQISRDSPNDSMEPIKSGTVPVIAGLSWISKKSRLDRCCSSRGRVPDKLVVSRFKCIRRSSKPTSLGMVPLIWFFSALNEVNVDINPISVGMVPVKEQLDKVSVSNFVKCAILGGIGPRMGVSFNIKKPERSIKNVELEMIGN